MITFDLIVASRGMIVSCHVLVLSAWRRTVDGGEKSIFTHNENGSNWRRERLICAEGRLRVVLGLSKRPDSGLCGAIVESSVVRLTSSVLCCDS